MKIAETFSHLNLLIRQTNGLDLTGSDQQNTVEKKPLSLSLSKSEALKSPIKQYHSTNPLPPPLPFQGSTETFSQQIRKI